MTRITHDNIEAGVRELFDRQADAMTVSERTWDDAPMVNVTQLQDHRARRRVLGTGIAAIATVAIAAAVLAVVGVGGNATHVTTKNPTVAHQPGSATANPVRWSTNQVSFAADGFSIVADGKTFTAANSQVDVHSDPGDAHYQTLELTWKEHGVEMRLYIYFAADAHSWWATGVSTYNGKANGDWIGFHAPSMKTQLGSAFTGTLDLTSGRAQLHITNLRLEAFRLSPACAVQTGAFVVQSNESNIVVPAQPDMGYATYGELLDRATCTRVKDVSHYRLEWTAADPTLLHVKATDCSPDVIGDEQCATNAYADFTATRSGTTTVHLAAVDTRTNKVVAQTDIPIKAAA